MLRLLLLLYPRAFRHRLGEEALRHLRADFFSARDRGPVRGRIRSARLVSEFALQGILARMDSILGTAHTLHFGWSQDLRLAVRSSIRHPAFAVVSIVSVAIGVGLNATMFSIADTLFLRTIPGVDEPDRVLEIGTIRPGTGNFREWSFPEFLEARAEAPLAGMVFYGASPASLSIDGTGGEQVLAMFTTAGYFDVLGAELALGRDFARSEETGPGAHPIVILSHDLWEERYESDPGVLGGTITVNREPHTVVGVVSERFRGHLFGMYPALYLPITQQSAARADPERFFEGRTTMWGSVLGRMGSGTTVDEVNAALATIFGRLAREHPESNRDRGARAARAGMAPADARSLMGRAFALITALALLVLAATAANVAGMLLARASAREREVAVRAALGSGRARLVRHLMTEAFVVFGIGGGLGVLLATRILRIDPNAWLPVAIPVELQFVLDWRIGLFGLGLTGVTGLAFGLLPALRVTRRDLAATLRDGTGATGLRAGRLRRAFVGGQVAISVLLLVTSGLFVRSLLRMSDLSAGLETEGIYLTGFDLALDGYDDPEQALALVDRLLEAVRAMPDVAGATVATDMPADGGSSATPVWPDGRRGEDDPWIRSTFGRISDGYFEALGIPVLRGRAPGRQDGPHTERVAVVNESFAVAAWPESEAVGRTIELGLEPHIYTVIGVVADTKTDMITERQSPQVFSYLPQDFDSDLQLATRRHGDRDDFVPRVRSTILEVDPRMALTMTRSLDELAALGLLPTRLMAGAGTTLALLALLLSSLGLYGVVAFGVTRRTREIGVRIALGAARRNVIARVLGGGMMLALPGIAFGVALALGAAPVVGGVLPFSPFDPVTYITVATILLGVIVAACIAPAWRAAAVQPMDALRVE